MKSGLKSWCLVFLVFLFSGSWLSKNFEQISGLSGQTEKAKEEYLFSESAFYYYFYDKVANSSDMTKTWNLLIEKWNIQER